MRPLREASPARFDAGPDLTALLAEPTRALALEPQAAAALLGPVAALTALLAARVGQSPPGLAPAAPDRLFGAGEAAVKLGCAKDWIYRHAKALPFTVRLGGHLRFSEQGIERYIRQRRR